MNGFVFQNTIKVYFGKNQLKHLGEELKTYGKKVLLVYGGGSIKKIGSYDKVLKEIAAAGRCRGSNRLLPRTWKRFTKCAYDTMAENVKIKIGGNIL